MAASQLGRRAVAAVSTQLTGLGPQHGAPQEGESVGCESPLRGRGQCAGAAPPASPTSPSPAVSPASRDPGTRAPWPGASCPCPPERPMYQNGEEEGAGGRVLGRKACSEHQGPSLRRLRSLGEDPQDPSDGEEEPHGARRETR